MDRSMFSKASSSKSRLLSSPSREPRWRTPSPMSASIIPPPIVQSMYASPSRSLAQSIVVDPPSPLQDRQAELEADLQYLLDAQAEGLLRGLEGGLQDDQTSTGSTTPTAQSVRSASARRGQKAIRKKPGLRASRRGIYNAILALSTLKDDELRDIDGDVLDKEQKLEKIEGWEKKRQGLQEGARSADSNEDTIRVQRLRQEAHVLQEEINAVELQLMDMKSRHRKLMRQASAVENTVQAKLASYTTSLRILEEDVQKFLSLEPAEGQDRPPSRDGATSMWQLPPKRRTLEMAKQHWSEERESILDQRQSIEHEKAALDEGAAVWKDVVAQVSDFERLLRTETSNLSTASPSQAMAASSSQSSSQRLEDLLQHMGSLTETLDSKFQLAKDRNWNLLVAAVGAELDALKQGKQLLQGLLHPEDLSSNEAADALATEEPNQGSGNEINELDKSFHTASRRMSNGTDSDDPDPELLFSKHDTDTE